MALGIDFDPFVSTHVNHLFSGTYESHVFDPVETQSQITSD
jgi:hypothetical protein